nr:hypothetical protein L204_05560 [Cryptococcus depauperatus CBS 7855]
MGIILSIFRSSPRNDGTVVISHPYPLGVRPQPNASQTAQSQSVEERSLTSQSIRLRLDRQPPPTSYHYLRSYEPTSAPSSRSVTLSSTAASTLYPASRPASTVKSPLRATIRSRRLRAVSFIDQRNPGLVKSDNGRGWNRILVDENGSSASMSMSISAPSSPTASPRRLNSSLASLPVMNSKGHSVDGIANEDELCEQLPSFLSTSPSTSKVSSSITVRNQREEDEADGGLLMSLSRMKRSSGGTGKREKDSGGTRRLLRKIRRVEGGWDFVREGDWEDVNIQVVNLEAAMMF